jgi:hypothetical protein
MRFGVLEDESAGVFVERFLELESGTVELALVDDDAKVKELVRPDGL